MSVSPKCEARLKQPPPCDAGRREIAGWVICKAWGKVITDRKDMSTAMKESWAELKERCKR